MNPSLREAGIPVLTEIIAAPPFTPPRDSQSEIDEGKRETIPQDADLVSITQDEHQLLRENVLLELENHFASSLGPRIQARVLEKLQDAAVEIAEEVKRELLLELAELRASASINIHEADFKNQ